ncbi:MAG: hypothetical protein KTR13_03585 [Saprospiraceae bacterium]|nr:hypothetical protein [Saprospiraceae bacterium]
MKTIFSIVCFVTCFTLTSSAQILKDIQKAKDKIGGITVDKLSRDPITTSFKDVDKNSIQPETLGADENYANLHAQPFDPSSGFSLSPGYYEADVQSFCVKAGTYMPTQGSGRFYAELKGPKADIFETLLYALHNNREVDQRDVQLLMWAIIAKTDFKKMSGPIKLTALELLSTKDIARLSKGSLEALGEKKLRNLAMKNDATAAIIRAENNLRSKFYQGVRNYAEYEEIAMLAGVEPVVTGYEKGKWSKHPDGYYVRYIPYGYSRTNVQVYVPSGSGTVIFNALGDIAVPASTNAQRLLQTNIPWDDPDWSYGNPTSDDPKEVDPTPPAEEPDPIPEETDEPDEATSTQEVPCDIDTDTILENTPAEVDYVINCVVDITAKLTIEAGTVIEFGENGGLGVYDNGFLRTLGLPDQKVIFRGTINGAGTWRGIHTENNTELVHTEIDGAGRTYVYCCNETAAIMLKGGDLTITKSTISNTTGCGIYAKKFDDFTESGNTFSNNSEGPICYGPAQRVCGDVDAPTVWKNTQKPVDYVVTSNCVIDITSDLTIEAGTVIEFEENAGLGVYDNGTLKVLGTATEKVILRGTIAGQGTWRGIHTENETLIQHAEIDGAGSNYVYCCNQKATLFVKGGDTSIENTSIKNSGGCGIYLRSYDSFNDSNVSFSNNLEGEICVQPQVLNDIDTPTVLSNGPGEVDYIVNDNNVVDVTSNLTIEPGVVIEFGEGAGLGVYDGARLNIAGSATESVVMKGKMNQVGYWRGIHLEGSNHSISNAMIKNAGSNYVYCCNNKAGVLLKDGSLSLTNSQLLDSGGCGVYVRSSGTLTESGNTFTGNVEGNICN